MGDEKTETHALFAQLADEIMKYVSLDGKEHDRALRIVAMSIRDVLNREIILNDLDIEGIAAQIYTGAAMRQEKDSAYIAWWHLLNNDTKDHYRKLAREKIAKGKGLL